MSIVSFGCNILKGINKAGNLKRDSEGYFLDVVVGAFDVPNSVGDVYPLSYAKQYFVPESPLIRRATKGCLFGEMDHPQVMPGMSKDDYFRRLNVIDMSNASHNMRNLRLVNITNPQTGEQICAVLADVLPVRKNGEYLEKELLTPSINVAFSLRSICRDVVRPDMRFNKLITRLITYDWVNEGGIVHAQKYNSPGLENWREADLYAGVNIHFMEDEVKSALESPLEGVGLESAEVQEEMASIFAPIEGTSGGICIPAKRWLR